MKKKTSVRRRRAYRNPKCLKENPRNARKHSQKQLAQIEAAIKRFGFTNPILVEENAQIIAGHARCAAAIALGLAQLLTLACVPFLGLGDTPLQWLAEPFLSEQVSASCPKTISLRLSIRTTALLDDGGVAERRRPPAGDRPHGAEQSDQELGGTLEGVAIRQQVNACVRRVTSAAACLTSGTLRALRS